jgi:cyclopropane-fatty-acyl-phospholipid synthase
VHRLKPHFEDVQAHYDLSDEFFRLFLDPSQTYSCAYFEKDDYTLEQAQLAKIDLALGKLGLQPGMTLLDVGCGWGSTMRRAVEKYDVNVIGLTLSKNQATYVQQKFDEMDSPRVKRVLLEGWEQFNEPVDRIVSIGAFEHFGDDRYQDFFKMAYEAMPEDGVMLLETITGLDIAQAREQGIRLTFALARFTKFIMTEIFPGGRLPSIPMVEERATERGFSIERVQHLQSHYAQTLDIWSAALEAHKDEAIDIQSEEVYERYMKYLTGCATLFREGLLDACQFTFAKGIYVAPDEVEEVVEKSRRAKDSNRFGQDLVAHGQSRTGVYSVKLKRDTTTRVTLPQVANQPFEVVLSEAPCC